MSNTQPSLTLEAPVAKPRNGKADKMDVKAVGRGHRANRKRLEAFANTSGIFPTEFNILVRPDAAEETIKTQSGVTIYKPIDTVDKEEHASQTGTLIAVSPLAFTYETWPEGSRKPQVGDKVIFAKYAGFLRRGKDGKDYRIAKDKDIVAIFEE